MMDFTSSNRTVPPLLYFIRRTRAQIFTEIAAAEVNKSIINRNLMAYKPMALKILLQTRSHLRFKGVDIDSGALP